jgi:hypothetical protein
MEFHTMAVRSNDESEGGRERERLSFVSTGER